MKSKVSLNRVQLGYLGVIVVFCLVGLGCSKVEQEEDVLDSVEISSFEEIEGQIHQIESTVRERDARERVYFHFYAERDAILAIAKGEYNINDPLHRALAQEMAWVTLGELLERRPDFQINIEQKSESVEDNSEDLEDVGSSLNLFGREEQ